MDYIAIISCKHWTRKTQRIWVELRAIISKLGFQHGNSKRDGDSKSTQDGPSVLGVELENGGWVFWEESCILYIYIYSELEDCLEMGFDIINNGSNLVCQVLIE